MQRFVLALLMAFLLFPAVAFPQNLQLSGKWQMTYDPDGPVVADWMMFRDDGTVEFGDNEGVYLACVYDGDADSVVAVCEVRGTQQKLVFQVRDNFRNLVNPTGAVYSKTQ